MTPAVATGQADQTPPDADPPTDELQLFEGEPGDPIRAESVTVTADPIQVLLEASRGQAIGASIEFSPESDERNRARREEQRQREARERLQRERQAENDRLDPTSNASDDPFSLSFDPSTAGQVDTGGQAESQPTVPPPHQVEGTGSTSAQNSFDNTFIPPIVGGPLGAEGEHVDLTVYDESDQPTSTDAGQSRIQAESVGERSGGPRIAELQALVSTDTAASPPPAEQDANALAIERANEGIATALSDDNPDAHPEGYFDPGPSDPRDDDDEAQAVGMLLSGEEDFNGKEEPTPSNEADNTGSEELEAVTNNIDPESRGLFVNEPLPEPAPVRYSSVEREPEPVRYSSVEREPEPVRYHTVERNGLTGRWIGRFYNCDGQRAEQVVDIVQDGDNVVATKVTGDACVRAGMTTFRGVLLENGQYGLDCITGSRGNPGSSSFRGRLNRRDYGFDACNVSFSPAETPAPAPPPDSTLSDLADLLGDLQADVDAAAAAVPPPE